MSRTGSRVLRAMLAVAIALVVCVPVSARKRRAVAHPAAPVLRFTCCERNATVEDSPVLDPSKVSAMTIELTMFRTGDLPGYATPFTRVQDGGPMYNMSISFDQAGNEVVYFVVRDRTGNRFIHGSGTPFPRGRWVHAALVFDGRTARAYVDGALYGSETMSSMPIVDAATEPFFIGHGFSGAIRNLRVWHRALSASEIEGLGRGVVPSESGLAAHWPLNDGSGDTPRDVGPHKLKMFLGSRVGADGHDPQWLDGKRLGEGPYWERRFLPSPPFPGWTGLVTDATGDGLPDVALLGSVPPENVVCEFPYFKNMTLPSYTAFRNLGDRFVEAPSIVMLETAGYGNRLEVQDLTGDGRKDVLLIDNGPEFPFHQMDCGDPGVDHKDIPGGQNRIFVVKPEGRLQEETSTRFPRRIAYDHAYALIDVDGDSDLDLYLGGRNNLDPGSCAQAARVPGTPCPVILMNNGNGVFTEDFTRLPESVASHRNEQGRERYYTAGQAIDVDRDGDQDLALGGWSNGLSGPDDPILINDGTGRFQHHEAFRTPARRPDYEIGNSVYQMDAADFDGDDWQDLVSCQYTGTYVYFNNGDGTFSERAGALPASAARGGSVCKAAELNGDQAIDLFCYGRAGEHPVYARLPMTIYYNRGDGTFEEMPLIDDLGEGDPVFAMDADGDGDTDLIGLFPGIWVAYQQRPYRPVP